MHNSKGLFQIVSAKENVERGRAHQDKETVIINVGGFVHRVKWETIDKFPRSRLQDLKNATSDSEFAK